MKEYTYKAFISYRHMNLDKKVAEKLQKMLEEYKPPKEYRRSKKNWRVFRDETELPTSSNLSDDIKSALSNSEFLIVVCSKATSTSRWCMEEINQFKALHNGTNENIITLLVEGEPDEVFPRELCTTLETHELDDGTTSSQEVVVEPLAANITANTSRERLKKLNTEFLRVVAPMLGCGYDDLYNRNRKRRMRRLIAGVAAAFVCVTLFGVYSSIMLMQINEQKNQLQAKNEELELRTQELNTSNSNLESANDELDKANKELDDANVELENANTQLDTSNSSLTETNSKLDSANIALSKSNKDLDNANNTLQKTNDKLQQTNAQLDKSNEELQNANSELDSANTALTKSNADLAQKTKEANDNLDEANTQRDAAEANLEEANRQKALAEQNLTFAEKQRALAEKNYKYAEEQRQEAETNLALVKAKNQELSIAGANMAAQNAKTMLENGDRTGAIETALSVRPYEDEPTRLLPSTMSVLADATYAYQYKSDCQNDRQLQTTGTVKSLFYNPDGTKLIALDELNFIYAWDVNSGEKLCTIQCSSLDDAEFIDNDNLIFIDDNIVKKLNITSGQIEEIYDVGVYSSYALSGDKSVMAVWGLWDGLCFINTNDGSVIYKPDFEYGPELTMFDNGTFCNNSKYISILSTSYFESSDGDYILVEFDLENKTYKDVYKYKGIVRDVDYVAADAFAVITDGDALGSIFSSGSDKSKIRIINDAGKELYSGELDFGGLSDAFFANIGVDEYQPALVMTYMSNIMVFDIKSMETIFSDKAANTVKKIIQTNIPTQFRVLCQGGEVYNMNLDADNLFQLQSFGNIATDIAWGNGYNYAVGTYTTNIQLYKPMHDDNYTEINAKTTDEPIGRNIKYNKDNSLFTTRDDHLIIVYDAETKTKKVVIDVGDSYTEHYFYEKYIVMLTSDRILHLYDIEHNGEEIQYDLSDLYLSTYVKVSDDESCIILYSYSNDFLRIDKSGIHTIREGSKEKIGTSQNHNNTVSSDGSFIMYSEREFVDLNSSLYRIKLLNTVTGEDTILSESNEDTLKNYGVNSMPFAVCDDSSIAAVTQGEKIDIYRTDTGELVKCLTTDAPFIDSIIFIPNSRELIVFGSDNVLYRYDSQTGDLKASIELPPPSSNYLDVKLKFNMPRNQLIVRSTTFGHILFIDLDTMTCVTELGLLDDFDTTRQETAVSNFDNSLIFYPYYTSEQLIERAETAVLGKL